MLRRAHAHGVLYMKTGNGAKFSAIDSSYLAPGKVPIRFGWEIRFPDAVIAGSQSDDRKSKIGLRHGIKLNLLYSFNDEAIK